MEPKLFTEAAHLRIFDVSRRNSRISHGLTAKVLMLPVFETSPRSRHRCHSSLRSPAAALSGKAHAHPPSKPVFSGTMPSLSLARRTVAQE
jgi:hypothetical protein